MADPARNNYEIARGSGPTLQYTVTGAPTADPASGWATKWTIRVDESDSSYLLQITGSWNSTTSTIDVTITRTQTLTLTAGSYVASLFRTTSGSEELVARDTVIVTNSIYDAA